MPDIQKNPIAAQLAALWDQSNESGSDMEGMLAELGGRLMKAQAAETGAGNQLADARATPIPQANSTLQAIMSSLGNAASGLTGSDAPSQQATSMIQEDVKTRQAQRAEQLKQLEDAYQRAADRASKLGDLDTELKFREKLAKSTERRHALLQMMGNAQQNEAADTRQTSQQDFEREQNRLKSDLQRALAQSEALQKQQLQQLENTSRERIALIGQGLDPNDQSKALTHSKAQRVRDAAASGYVSSKDWAIRFAKITDESRKQGMTGIGGPKYNVARLRNLVLNGLPPDISYATDPEAYMDVLLGLADPEDPTGTKYLFPRDKKNPELPEAVWAKRINAYLNRWWPNYVPEVAAIDSVGR